MRLFDYLKRFVFPSDSTAEGTLVDTFFRKFRYKFIKSELLFEALTHRSFVHYNDHIEVSSERLEFLGDSVLGVIIAEYLHNTYPDYNEGDLTKSKALLVNETTLSMIGREIGLNDLILMSPEEEKSGGRERNSIISDAMEAVIGAIYLDGGLNRAREYVTRTIVSHADEIFADSNQRNYKGELLEYLQHLGQPPPFYEVVSEEGPDHMKTFNVVVKTFGEISGSGSGQSKKEAEQKAAAEALSEIKSKKK